MDTGYAITTRVNRVEKLSTRKGHPQRWRLHTDDGIYLTSENPVKREPFKLKGNQPQEMTLLIRGERVINWK